MNTLLLTGTIDPSKFNNSMTTLSDINIRLKQYNNAIVKWIEKSKFEKLIFIENSGYQFDYKKYQLLAQKNNKQFEYILAEPFVDETIKFGKSYGEIKLINEAIERSNLLKNEDSFYKCTGRLYIKNCNSILKQEYCNDTVFSGIPSDKWVFTWFFKVNKNFYNKYLYDAYEKVNDYKGIFMEHVYYNVLVEHLDEVNVFRKYPNVAGVSAGTNSKYHSNLLSYGIKNIRLKKGFFGVK